MGMKEDYQKYRDCNGLLQTVENPPPPGNSGNGILYTGEMFVNFALLDQVTDEDRTRWVSIIRSLEVSPGLINRNPPTGPHPDQEAFDDYVGLTTSAYLMGGACQQICEDIFNQGQKTYWGISWIYNNVSPQTPLKQPDGSWNWSALLLKSPAVVSSIYTCSGRVPPFIYRLAWAITIGTASMRDRRTPTHPSVDSGARILSWLLIQALPPKKYPLCEWGAKFWWKRFKQDYPGGINQAFSEYFGPQHPLTLYSVTNWPKGMEKTQSEFTPGSGLP